jgi:hypothetical protein
MSVKRIATDSRRAHHVLTESYPGYWWIAGEPDSQQPGVLRLEDDGSSHLELIGGFDTSTRTPQPNGSMAIGIGEKNIELIHGLSEGKQITCVHPIILLSRGNLLEAPNYQRLQPQRVLIGTHLSSLNDAVFKSAIIRLENLTLFAATGSQTHIQIFDDKTSHRSSISDTASPEALDDNGWTYIAETTTQGFRKKVNRGASVIAGDYTTRLKVLPREPSPLAEFDRVALEFMDLLTLAMGSPCGVISLELVHTSTKERHYPTAEGQRTTVQDSIRVQEHGRRVHRANADALSPRRHDVRFTCADVPFDELIPAWLRVRRAAAPACNVFFGMDYSPEGYIETKLMTTAIAAEALQGALLPEDTPPDATGLTSDEIAAIRDHVRNAITDPKHLRWVLSRLSSTLSFRDRMESLARCPDPEAASTLIPDVRVWSRSLRDIRNGLTHAGGAAPTHDQFDMLLVTQGLLSLVFMSKVGLSAEVQRRVALIMAPAYRS